MIEIPQILVRSGEYLARIKHHVLRKARLNAAFRLLSEAPDSHRPESVTAHKQSVTLVIHAETDGKQAVADLLASISGQADSRVDLLVFGPEQALAAPDLDRLGAGVSVTRLPVADAEMPTVARIAETARGDYLFFVAPGACLAGNALAHIRDCLSRFPFAEAVYCDSFVIDAGGHPLDLNARPAFDPVLLAELDYVGASFLYRRATALDLGRRQPAATASARDLLLPLDPDKVIHLPYPAVLETAGRRSFPLPIPPVAEARADEDWPQVHVIIPSRNGFDLIRRTLEGLYDGTDYPCLDVTVVDNGSDDPRVLALYDAYQARHASFRALIQPEAFNFSRSVNRGLAETPGGPVLLLNNDIEVISPGWLKEMVACLDVPQAGIIGAKLLFPNDTLQHAGVIVGMNDKASHWYYKQPKATRGVMNRLTARNSMSCVTGAAMLISEACRTAVGAWDEDNFAVAYNDVDFCLRARKAGFRSIVTPHAVLYHHESVSRGKDKSRQRKAQFEREKQALRTIHGTDRFEDPAFSPWLAKTPGPITFRRRRTVPPPRTWWSD